MQKESAPVFELISWHASIIFFDFIHEDDMI